MKKEFNEGDIAYIGRNIKVKFFDGYDTRTRILKCDTEVKILKSERISDKCGKYGYYIEILLNDKPVKSTHSISQFDFYSKNQWQTKLHQEALLKELSKKDLI